MTPVATASAAAAFEVRAQLRTFSAPLVAFCLALTTVAYGNSADYLSEIGAADLPRNSAYSVYVFTATPLFVFLFYMAHVASAPIVRDVQHRMGEVLHTMPGGSRAYLFGKWLGVLAVGHAIGLAIPLSFLAYPALAAAGVLPTSVVAPTPWGHLLHAYAVYVTPLVWILGSLYFGLALLSGRATGAYAASFGAAVVWMFSYVVLWEGGVQRTWAEWLDPIGYTSIIAQTSYWTAEQKRSAFLAVTPDVATNRGLYAAVAASVFALAMARPQVARLVSVAVGNAGRPTPRASGLSAAPARPVLPPRAYAAIALGAGLARFRSMARTWLFRGVLAVSWLMGVGSTWVHILAGHDGRKLPWVGLAWPACLEHGFVLSVFYLCWTAGHLVRRERDHGAQPLLDVLPVPRWVLVAPGLLTLSLVALCLAAVPALAVAALQALVGQETWAPAPLVFLTLLSAFPTFLQFGLLAFAIYGLIPSRRVAHFAAFGAMLACVLDTELSLVSYDLALYGIPLRSAYSHLTGLTAKAPGLVSLGAFFLLAGGLLVGAAITLWPRGAEGTVRGRLALARQAVALPSVALAAGALVAAVALGSYVHRTIVANRYQSPDDERAERAAYELAFAGDASPKLTLQEVHLAVAPRPDDGEVRVATTLSLTNPEAGPVAAFVLDPPEAMTYGEWSSDRGPLHVRTYNEARRTEITLAEPLLPGDTVTVRTEGVATYRGFRHRGEPQPLASRGVWLTEGDLMPYVGYDATRELTSDADRRRFGLGTRRPPPEGALPYGRSPRPVRVEVHVDPPAPWAGEVAVLTSQDGRVSQAGPASVAVAAGVYRVVAGEVRLGERTVKVEVYHDGRRGVVAGAILSASRLALESFSARYGPYDHDALRIVQTPRGVGEGRLAGTLLLLPEELVFDHDPAESAADHVLFHVSRFVARHWFQEHPAPQGAPGERLLADALPYAAALGLVGEHRGRAVLARHADQLADKLVEAVAHADRALPAPVATDGAEALTLYAGLALYGARAQLGAAAFDAAAAAFRAAPHRNVAAFLGALPAGGDGVEPLLRAVSLADTQVLRAEWAPGEGRRLRVHVRVREYTLRGRDWEERGDARAGVPLALAGVDGNHLLELETRPGELLEIPVPADAEATSVHAEPWRTRVERNPRDNQRALPSR